jgi:alkanesulfonate monooxygenase SsuD/methylene tetrahydromethanopterin reductase-like flavin-dependent oxidoreductase (luciferase family)
MHFGYGLITAQHHPDDARTDVEIYREALELAVEAERIGFDSVWTSEHHFVDDGYMPSQLPVLAAIAARTERILLGTGVLLAPMFDPLHLAEDAATVDVLSNGRLVLGLGLGWRDEEFAGLGGADGHKGRRLESMIEVLRQAWADGLVGGDTAGLFRYREPGLSVTPKPARPGGLPIWIGASAPRALERAGRVADGYLSSGADPTKLAQRLEIVRRAAAGAGRDPGSVTGAVHRVTFAWRDGDPWERIREHARYITWKYAEMTDARGSRARRRPPRMSAEEEAELRGRTIVGTPEEVAEQIEAYREVLGPDGHFIVRSYFPGLDPAVQREALRILGDEVRPLIATGPAR